jgi:hypothetical protein
MLAGRLRGTLDGRPVTIEAEESGIEVVFGDVRSAWSGRRIAEAVVPAFAALKAHGIPLRVSVARLVTVNLLPEPGLVARAVVPGLDRLARSFRG